MQGCAPYLSVVREHMATRDCTPKTPAEACTPQRSGVDGMRCFCTYEVERSQRLVIRSIGAAYLPQNNPDRTSG